MELLQSIMDTGVQNVATDRVDYILTWLKVGADQDDFRAPGGDKTFEGLFLMAECAQVLPKCQSRALNW